MRIICLFIQLFTSMVSHAEQRVCSLKIAAAYSAAPIAGKPLPAVKKRLPTKTLFVVVRESPGWVLLQVETVQLWSERSNFGLPDACSGSGVNGGAVKRMSTSQTKTSSGKQSASSCPCGSAQICRGPRGGRYCIAPSGAKRYGV
jgi:hypothetical protein